MQYPLVILLHGQAVSSDKMLGLDGMKAPYKVWLDIPGREKIFVLVPEGVVSPDDKLGWNDCRADAPNIPSTDDVGFITTLIDAMATTYPIDENRIYANGTSNGGFLVFRLATEVGHKFAAIAPVAAALPKISKCSEPSEAVALLMINGTADTFVQYDGGMMENERGQVVSSAETISAWATLNQNTSTSSIETLPDIDESDASTILITRYAGKTRRLCCS